MTTSALQTTPPPQMCVIVICCELHVTVTVVMTVRDCALVAVESRERDTQSTGIVQLYMYMTAALESSRDYIMTSSCTSGVYPLPKNLACPVFHA